MIRAIGLDNKGIALVLTILLIGLLYLLTTTLTIKARLHVQLAHNLSRSRQALYVAEGGIDLVRYLLLVREEEETLFQAAERVLEGHVEHELNEEKKEITILLEEYLFFVKIKLDHPLVILESRGRHRDDAEYRKIRAVIEESGDENSLLSWEELKEE